jgi:DNA mismatch endonuclease (patch repair protein)
MTPSARDDGRVDHSRDSGNRSRNMRAIKAADTLPEMIVRRYLHSLGYRFRLHDKRLPGRPDLVFSARKSVLFVNGCFWHSHDCQFGRVRPRTNADFWAAKRDRTVARDVEQRARLEQLGWRWMDVWECELRYPEWRRNVVVFLGDSRQPRGLGHGSRTPDS